MRPSISKAVRHVASEVAAGARLNLLPRLPPPAASRALDAERRLCRGTREKMLPLLLQPPEPWVPKPPIICARAMYIQCKRHETAAWRVERVHISRIRRK